MPTIVAPEGPPKRLDQLLSQHLDYSRSQIQKWIQQGCVSCPSISTLKARTNIPAGTSVDITIPAKPDQQDEACNIPLNILFEDEHILIINKPSDLTVHPGAGQPNGTLMNGLLFHDANLSQLPRAGIVHRLDKDTSGLMIIAKSEISYQTLIASMKERQIKRHYLALVYGHWQQAKTVSAAIRRHATRRTLMSTHPSGKPAITHFTPLQHLESLTLLRCELDTGRTHQIRVHCLHQGYPIVGDGTYKQNTKAHYQLSEKLSQRISNLKRQFLHADHLSLPHPTQKRRLCFYAPLADDLIALIPENLQPNIMKLSKENPGP